MSAMNMDETFNLRLRERYDSSRSNSKMLDRNEYNEILSALQSNDSSMSPKKKWELKKRYVVQNIAENEYRLLRKDSMKIVLPIESIYNAVKETHEQLGHAGRNVMMKNLKEIYANVGYSEVSLFLDCCEQCQLKARKDTLKSVSKPIIEVDFNCRGQVDLIDMQTRPDGDYKFILNYQDHFTKFIKLRPLKRKTAEEVATVLLEIFLDMGCPTILHTDNGRELKNKHVEKLVELWPESKMVHGKPRHSESQGSVERANQDVERKLICWMTENNTENWARALPFIQHAKNRCYHEGIGMTPFQALYGNRTSNFINSLKLPPTVLEDLKSEEDLRTVVQRMGARIIEDDDSSSLNHEVECDTSSLNHGHEVERVINAEQCNMHDETEVHDDHVGLQGNEDDNIEEIPIEGPANQKRIEKHVSEIHELRKRVNKRLHDQASVMLERAEKRLKTAEIGMSVKVQVPEVDRGRSDHPNILGVIMEKKNEMFRIGTKWGILEQLYTRNMFDICKESFLRLDEVRDCSISLRSAVGMASVSNTSQGFIRCNCKSKCVNATCGCKKKNVLCNSKCHSSMPCNNK